MLGPDHMIGRRWRGQKDTLQSIWAGLPAPTFSVGPIRATLWSIDSDVDSSWTVVPSGIS